MYVSRPVGDAYSIALQGMQAAQGQLVKGAYEIASGNPDRFADAFVEIMLARRYFAANAKVVQAQQDMDRSLLDIIA